ncbi:YfiR family protein [Amphritea sp.]|uniref:YfiR family protein n=1 Tax=Amphritea sp. TaxID=1872502 RepID=UPI003A91A45F
MINALLRLRLNPRYALSATLLFTCLLSPDLTAAPSDPRLQQVKAAILFNIARFVRWPEPTLGDPNSTALTLCHYHENTLASASSALIGKPVQHRHFAERHIESLDQVQGCAILFIPWHQLSSFSVDQAHHSALPVLTVADLTEVSASQVVTSTAAVNLIRQDARISLDIFLPELQRSGLTISSEVLKLAKVRR